MLGGVDDAFEPRERGHEVREAELERILHADARLEVARGSDTERAHTAPPAWASTMFSPIERSSVLLPDMFEPVTRSTRSGRADGDVVGDAAVVGE